MNEPRAHTPSESTSGQGSQPCPCCRAGQPSRVLFIFKEGEPPGHPNHQIVYDDLQLHQCNRCLRGVLSRLKHDCSDFEAAWDDRDDYWIDAASMKDLGAALTACPHPQEPECECAIHVSLRNSLKDLPSLQGNGDFRLIPRLRSTSKSKIKFALIDGDAKVEYESGKLRLQAKLAGGRLSGHACRYHESGMLAEEGNFNFDRRDGTWVEYDDTGRAIVGAYYEKGNLIRVVEPNEAAEMAKRSGTHSTKDLILGCLLVIGIPVVALILFIWTGIWAWHHQPTLMLAALAAGFTVWTIYMLWNAKKSR